MKSQPGKSPPAAELRHLAEVVLSERKGNLVFAVDNMPADAVRQLLHELQVHQIELEMQNEELRRSREELEVARARYFDLYDLAPVGYFTVDADARIQEVNLTAVQLTGFERGSMIDQPFTSLVARESQDAFFLFWRGFIEPPLQGTPPSTYLDLMLLRPDKTKIWTKIHVTQSTSISEHAAYRIVLSDISERVKLTEQNKRFAVEAEQTLRLQSLGTLAAGIAHDFNSLLTGVFGNIDLALHHMGESSEKEFLLMALTALERTRALTTQLMTFAKGGAPLMQVGDIAKVARESTLFALSGSNVASSFAFPEDLWPCSFDTNQICQVFDNLVSNARQALSGGGNIRIEAANHRLANGTYPGLTNGPYVEIRLSDSGPGVTPDVLKRIFDPFFTTNSANHGLGLATCRSIMTRHGGAILADNVPGGGMVFTLLLPAMETATPAPVARLVEPNSSTKTLAGTIGIVDDNEAIRELFGHMAANLGCKARPFENCFDAIAYMQSGADQDEPLMAIILDLTIPGSMGGIEAVGLIRKLEGYEKFPIIASSGYSDAQAMIHPDTYGFTTSLAKPYRITELVDALHRAIR